MKLKVILLDKRYCEPCPYQRGVCGCSKYLYEGTSNTNVGCTKEGKAIRLEICRKENGD